MLTEKIIFSCLQFLGFAVLEFQDEAEEWGINETKDREQVKREKLQSCIKAFI